ncbi:MAG: DNA mismatch endonuclease Vsr [Chloroflexi bacterium]|nr:DNA mismatch endonuclease Vsr [Chloroflexota bacterium]
MGTDIFAVEKRSEIMSRVKSKNTGLELKVRSGLHRIGYRFRIHRNDLPGTPDIVLPKYHTVIFVHGCFWHQHPGCKKATRPKQNPDFWEEKLSRNMERDRQAERDLKFLGWNVLTVWECEINSKYFSNKMTEVSRQINEGNN